MEQLFNDFNDNLAKKLFRSLVVQMHLKRKSQRDTYNHNPYYKFLIKTKLKKKNFNISIESKDSNLDNFCVIPNDLFNVSFIFQILIRLKII